MNRCLITRGYHDKIFTCKLIEGARYSEKIQIGGV
jgi:hypothetical protein